MEKANTANQREQFKNLLGEAGHSAIPSDLASLDPCGAAAQADWNDLQSAENYLGYLRTQSFVSGALAEDKTHLYSPPKRLGLNEWALSGDWTAGREAIVSSDQAHASPTVSTRALFIW